MNTDHLIAEAIKAIRVGDLYTIWKLKAKGLNLNFVSKDGLTILYFVIAFNRPELIPSLIGEGGVDVNKTLPGSESSPLMIATRAGDKQMVEALLDAGADRDYENSLGVSALSIAIEKHNYELIELLSGSNV